MRLAFAAALFLAAPAHAQDVSCADFLQLHQEALEVAKTAQMAGVSLIAMPYSVTMTDEVAAHVSAIGSDLSGSWQPYLETFNDIATRSGCITPTE